MNFTQQYGKNRQRCQQNKFTMLYGNYCYIFIENFPQKFSLCNTLIQEQKFFLLILEYLEKSFFSLDQCITFNVGLSKKWKIKINVYIQMKHSNCFNIQCIFKYLRTILNLEVFLPSMYFYSLFI